MTADQESLNQMARTLREAGWGVHPPNQYTADMDSGFLSLWKQVQPYTMISIERAWALAQAVAYVCRSNVAGDIVECGVWKGGACLLASHVLVKEKDNHKKIWLYDTFEGMTSPGEEDCIASSGQPLRERNPEGWWTADIAEVRRNISSAVLGMERFRFVQGRVETTLKKEYPQQLSILRLDTDWYESTLFELEVLYPRLTPGGILIIDDYGHFTGARKAVDDFFEKQGIVPLLHRSDYTGRVMVKT